MLISKCHCTNGKKHISLDLPNQDLLPMLMFTPIMILAKLTMYHDDDDTVYWESFMEENIRKYCGFWNDCECFLVPIFYLSFILIKSVHGQWPLPFHCTI